MALSPEQHRIARMLINVGRRRGATPKEIKAALETGLVESNLRNLPGGDADSAGWRQERASIYKDPTNLRASINRFYNETKAVRGKYSKAGDLAAAVQRPAAQYRGRYAQRSSEASQLLQGLEGGRRGGGGGGRIGFDPSSVATTTRTPGTDLRSERAQAALSFLQGGGKDPVSFAVQMAGLRDTPGSSVTRTQRFGGGGTGKVAKAALGAGAAKNVTRNKGIADFEGKKVAAWIAPILHYARKNGWTGQVNSGYRSFAEQSRIYNSGVRPAAVPGTSNHEGDAFPRGAIDASNPTQLAAILRKSPYRKALVYAGAKDPVHFSHPHGGSY